MIQSSFEADMYREQSAISVSDRAEKFGQHGQIIWLTGENRSQMAYQLERKLFDANIWSTVVDAQDPRYLPIQTSSQAARVAKRMADSGLVVICSVISSDFKYAIESCQDTVLTVASADSPEAIDEVLENLVQGN